MPQEQERKIKGMPRSKKGDRFILIKTSKGFLVYKLKTKKPTS